MGTLKLDIKSKDMRSDGECLIFIRITQHGQLARMKTDFSVKPELWKDRKVVGGKFGDPNSDSKNLQLAEKLTEYTRILIDNQENIKTLDAIKIKEFLESGTKFFETDFCKFTDERIKELKKNKSKSVRHLENALTMVKNYHGEGSLSFNDINNRFLEGFASYYRNLGHKQNSIATYLRYIRRMYNLSIDEFNTNSRNPVILGYPFRKYKIKTTQTSNRNLSVEVIRSIRAYQFKTKREEISRDIFMLQFYWLGINIVDLFYLTKKNIIADRLQYVRHKTGRFYNIKIEPEAALLIEKYKGVKYLLWFADYCEEERKGFRAKHSRLSHFQYKDNTAFNKMLNNQLYNVQEALKLSLPTDLTGYYVRHSFASLMREVGVSKDTISLALGHKDVEQNLKTSGIYIAEDFGDIDLANRELIDFVNSSCVDGVTWKELKKKKKPPIKKA